MNADPDYGRAAPFQKEDDMTNRRKWFVSLSVYFSLLAAGSTGSWSCGSDEDSSGEAVDPPNDMEPGVGTATQVCADDGVCTIIHSGGCTVPGKIYTDYASCEDVIATRPDLTDNVIIGSSRQVPEDLSRLEDPDYAWSVEQLAACACTCCHRGSPQLGWGAHTWSLDFDQIWLESVTDSAIQRMPTFPQGLGNIDPELNNGFTRELTALPTTDPPRMRAFLHRELVRRGLPVPD